MTKDGLRSKVNRLPDDIKDELNKRLKVYYGADAVLEWLHNQQAVADYLKKGIIKRKFNAQNLSAWRKSKPYNDWIDRQNIENIQKETAALCKRVEMLEEAFKLIPKSRKQP